MANVNVITEFIQKVRWLHEVDSGDFKRKIGLYLHRMESQLNETQKLASRDLISRLRQDVIFNSVDNVEAARIRTLELAEQLRLRNN